MSIDKRFKELVEEAQNGSPNSIFEAVSKAEDDRASLMIKAAERKTGSITQAERDKINEQAAKWVRTDWTKEQVNILKGEGKDSGEEGLKTAGGIIETFSAFGNGMIDGIFSLARNFGNIFHAFIESFRSDRSFGEILAERKENDRINEFASKHGVNARQLAEELRNPPAASGPAPAAQQGQGQSNTNTPQNQQTAQQQAITEGQMAVINGNTVQFGDSQQIGDDSLGSFTSPNPSRNSAKLDPSLMPSR
ncbi:MAG: hypothetical protein R3D71_02070 [Rickettsiales bacterium]